MELGDFVSNKLELILEGLNLRYEASVQVSQIVVGGVSAELIHYFLVLVLAHFLFEVFFDLRQFVLQNIVIFGS